MTYHPRSDWTDTPAANANPVIRRLLKGVAIHWNGPAVFPPTLTDPRRYLESVRRYHVNTKGWSDTAYNHAVDQQGDVWQLRGWRHQSGANGDEKTNNEYLAILCIIGQDQFPSRQMLASVRHQVRAFRLHYPTKTAIVGHRDIRPGGTECPGDRLYKQLQAGTFRPLRIRAR